MISGNIAPAKFGAVSAEVKWRNNWALGASSERRHTESFPLVLGTPLPEQLFKIDQRKIVGLIIDIDSLQRIRKNRLEKFGQDPGGEYASLQHIVREIEYAEQLFKQNKRWPIFNVTDRALEETATEITRIVGSRMGWPDSALY